MTPSVHILHISERAKKFEVAGKTYYVGTSYGFKDKIGQIKKMLNICGVPQSTFHLVSYPELAKRPRL